MIKIDESIINGTSGSDSGMGRKMPPITEEEQEILEHHGILGMKWGKRKGKSKSSLSSTVPMTKNAKRLDEAAREKQFVNEYNSRDKMSTRSLQNRVKRLQTEQQFRELVNKPAAERAAAAAKIAEKKAKRNKMIMRTALSIYGNVSLASFGKKGKEYADVLGPSQALAKSAAGAIKNSDDISGSLLHSKYKTELAKRRNNMLHEEDIILHGSTIADSEGLLHGKYESKHKSKSGKWVYVYDNAKKAVGGLFDKDVDRTVIGGGQAEYTNRTAEQKRDALMYSHDLAFEDSNRLASKSNKNIDGSKAKLKKMSEDGLVLDVGRKKGGIAQATTKATYTVRKKGSIHKGYDSALRALKGLTK
jgi:hypothetical protein